MLNATRTHRSQRQSGEDEHTCTRINTLPSMRVRARGVRMCGVRMCGLRMCGVRACTRQNNGKWAVLSLQWD